MQVSKTFYLAAFASAFIMILSSTTYAGDKGGRNGDNGGNSENSCAAGNEPMPGVNCTN